MDLAVVEQHVDLAVEHDRVVDGSGPVRIGVPRVALGRRIDTHRAQDFNVIDRRCVRTGRSESTRKTVPFAGGGTPTGVCARSTAPAAFTGNSLVTQNKVTPLAPRCFAVAISSNSTTALPRASWPVTIRRVDRISIAVSSPLNPLAVAARIRQSCLYLCQAQTRMTGNHSEQCGAPGGRE